MTRLSWRIDRPRPGVVCVSLRGDLELASAYELDAELLRIERDKPRAIVIDLRGLRFMDSTGLARLLAAHRRARRGGWRLALVRGSETIQRVLRLTATEEVFDLVPDPAALTKPPT